MVYFSKNAENDLFNVFAGLINWDKHFIEFNHASQYVDDIRDECLTLDELKYHFQVKVPSYILFGKYLHRYRRNSKTIWYIIYNTDEYSNVYIQRIFSNHSTKDAERTKIHSASFFIL